MSACRDDISLPDGPLVAWYGDDFTGAAAVMEVLTFSGLPSVLFLNVPSPERISAFSSCRGIGIAGVSRSKPPEWMDRHLPKIFDAMSQIPAPIYHYKICSTLDSAPHVGSIGKAAEIAMPLIGSQWVPVVVAAPAINRYQAFGNLFAAVGGKTFRLDRHPTMSRHPVTPMTEADVLLHLGKQTGLPLSLVDAAAFSSGREEEVLAELFRNQKPLVALDVVDEGALAAVGRLIWRNRGSRLFTIGSQGVEYALTAHWREIGALEDAPTATVPASSARTASVSGSCSPVTAAQIELARKNGFKAIRMDTALAADSNEWNREIERASEKALAALGIGEDPIIFTALGPDDPSIGSLRAATGSSGKSEETVNESIGVGLGKVLAKLIDVGRVERVAIAGGDTAGRSIAELGIDALTAMTPISPGVALCQAHSDSEAFSDLQIALKGGQMGESGFFSQFKSVGTQKHEGQQ